nr:MAG TPA: hypothetical protein [Caudoviricetes sp.]DAH94603.1 MAG TPA: hypothetical protein [Caudoviricetes sp.]
MSELTELQETLVECNKRAELKKAVERLMLNPDFKKVIQEGYIEQEMQRHLSLAICDKLSSEDRELNNNLAKSAVALSNYLDTTIQFGRIAEEDIEQINERIEQLTAQGMDE